LSKKKIVDWGTRKKDGVGRLKIKKTDLRKGGKKKWGNRGRER